MLSDGNTSMRAAAWAACGHAAAPASLARTARRHAHFLERQGHQSGRDVFAGGHNRIIFTRIKHRGGLIDPPHQFIGFARHGRDDDDHIIAFGHFHTHTLCRAFDPVQGRDRRAAEFHHKNRHKSPTFLVSHRALRGAGQLCKASTGSGGQKNICLCAKCANAAAHLQNIVCRQSLLNWISLGLLLTNRNCRAVRANFLFAILAMIYARPCLL